jgi:hypothetical protein
MFQLISSITVLARAATAAYSGVAHSSVGGNFEVAANSNGMLIISNQCSFDVHIKSQDGNVGAPEAPLQHLRSKGVWWENIRGPIGNGADGFPAGTSVKISRNPNDFGKAITQIEYSVGNGAVWYDGSNIDCHKETCPFYNEGIMIQVPQRLTASESNCVSVTCPKGGCADGRDWYDQWFHDLATKNCKNDRTMTVWLCAEKPPAYGTKMVVDDGAEQRNVTAKAFTA